MPDKWDKFIVSDPSAAPAPAVDKWEKFAVSSAPAAAPAPTTPPPPPGPWRQPQGGATGWLDSLENDVKYGTGITLPGRALRALGAPGVYRGTSPGAAEKVASPILGPIHAAQGIAMTPDHPIAGPLKAIGGALQTADIPLAFMASAPEGLAEQAIAKVPSVAKEQAAQKFQQVMAAAGKQPLQDTAGLSDALSRYQELVKAGGSRSLPVSKLSNRLGDATQGPLTYKEARDFYSNLTRLSADDMSRLTPVMRSQVVQVTRALGASIQQAAGQAGVGNQYSQAMSQFRYGAQGEDALRNLAQEIAKPAIKAAAGGVVGGYVAKKMLGR